MKIDLSVCLAKLLGLLTPLLGKCRVSLILFRRRDMFKLKTHDLLKVYEKAIELNLEKDFIEILEVELQRRGATDLSKTWVK